MWQTIRDRSTDRRPPVAIAVTAYGGRSMRQATAAAGFRAHIVKPFDLQQVIRTIANACAHA